MHRPRRGIAAILTALSLGLLGLAVVGVGAPASAAPTYASISNVNFTPDETDFSG